MTHILIVDDSQTESLRFSQMLENNGFKVSMASSGEQGVATAAETKPDLVIMDVVMPGLNGFQATRQITRANDTSHIPVIIVTTKDQETDRVWAKRQGATAFLTKPVNEKTLIDAIRTALGES